MRALYILLCISISVLISCKTDTIDLNNSINIRLKKDIDKLNPLVFPNPIAREVYQYIFTAPADYNPESLELESVLLTKMPEPVRLEGGLIGYDIEFIEGATWDNGSPITAEDYLFTYKAILHPLTSAGNYRELVQNVQTITLDEKNNRKCRVIFKASYQLSLETAINVELYPRYFYDSLNVLAKYDLSDLTEDKKEQIESDSILVSFADRFNSSDFTSGRCSGAGPYRFVSWNKDQNIVLEKKKEYWGAKSKHANVQQGPDRINFIIIPDELTALAQLKAGNIDVINDVSADEFIALRSDSLIKDKFSFYTPYLIKHTIININNHDPKLSDFRVRKALAHLVDVEYIIQNIEKGMAIRTTGPIHPIKKSFNKDLTPIPYSVENAIELLTEAGWKDSNQNGIIDKMIDNKLIEMELDIYISGQELGKQLAILLQENAKKAGIKISIIQKEFKQIRAEHLATRNYHLIPSLFSQDLQTWDDLQTKWHSQNDIPGGTNDVGYNNPKTDELINKIETSATQSDKLTLYKSIQEQIYHDCPVIFLYAPQEKIIVSKKWKSTGTAKRPGYMANTFTLQ